MTDVKRELSQDHEDHQQLLQELADSLAANRPAEELRQDWAAFEENLFEHLDTVERSLFSVTAQAHRLEIEKLRTEHRQIRQAVVSLSVLIELHTPKKEALDELIALLQSHAAHEARSLHLWLEQDEGILARRGVLAIRSRRERSSPRLKAASKTSD